jgi:HEAT repeat protein
MHGVSVLRGRLRRLSGARFRDSVEALCGLFYVDIYDRPDLEPAVNAAVAAVGRAGRRAIPSLLRQVEGTDIKSHMHFAQALGLMGAEAVPALRRLLGHGRNAYTRSFALYALGKVHNPSVARALPEILAAAGSRDDEVRDSAVRTLGKVAESVRPSQLPPARRRAMYAALMRALGDPQAPVRAKAIRSLGKLVTEGHLTLEQIRSVEGRALSLLGRDEEFNWDHAYIVRHEAEETLHRIEEARPKRRRAR